MHGFPSIMPGGQKAFLIFLTTASGVSSTNIAEEVSDFDIFSCPSSNPGSILWERITGLCLIPAASQYSLASMLTFL
uniref:ABC transporter permease, putative n=1 Tax=Cryptosporidium parvum TaxID=5807 RepID=F0X562_CRYPV